MRWVVLPALVLALLSGACSTNKILFRNQQVHLRKTGATCDLGAIEQRNEAVRKEAIDVFDEGRAYLQMMDSCVVPGPLALADEADLCRYHQLLARMTATSEMDDDEADRAIEKRLRQRYDDYRKHLEDISRAIRNGLQELQRKSPQMSMLYLLEARLYLLTGYALEHQVFLLGGYDNEAASEWYRKVPQSTRQALSTNKSSGLAWLYEAESLARLGRCNDARPLLGKLFEAGYQTSSTLAVMAYCERGSSDGGAATSGFLNQAIERADREEASTWAYRYKRHLDERKDWLRRQRSAELKEEMDLVIDDALPDPRFSRLRLHSRLGDRYEYCSSPAEW